MSTTIRQAVEADIDQAVQVDKVCWPARLCFSKPQLVSILKTFPEGFIVAEAAGSVVGLITSLRINKNSVIGPYPPWQEITDRGRIIATHRPDGDCLFVMAVSVLPFVRSLSVGERLVNAEVDLARRLPGVTSLLGYTRIPRYKRKSHLPVAEYLALTRPDGRCFDPVLSFHLSNGAKILKAVEGARPNDEDSLGYGILISYDSSLGKTNSQGRRF